MQKEVTLESPIVPQKRTAEYALKDKDTGKEVGHMTQVVAKVLEDGEELCKIDVRTEMFDGDVMEESSLLTMGKAAHYVSCYLTTKNKHRKTLMETMIQHKALKPVMDSSVPSLSVCPVQTPCLSCANTLNCTPPGAMGFLFEACPFTAVGKSNLRIRVTKEDYLLVEDVKFSKEKVRVPAGDFECYKMDMTPDATPMMNNAPMNIPGGVKSVAQEFMPSILRWYSAKPPHCLIKYEGFRCMGTPEKAVIAELVSIEEED